MRTHSMLLAALLSLGALACQSAPQTAGFPTPQAALHELADLIGTHDQTRAERLLGKDGPQLLQSGDEVADREDGQRVQQYVREKIAFEDHGPDTKIALLGNEAWPFPIPLVRAGGNWHFDVAAGLDEIASRRIGRDELSTIASLHAYVDAQREYAASSHDGRPAAYARKVISTSGQHDGLYWPAVAGEAESPLGPLIAGASADGYALGAGQANAYHGYYFRTLTEQGKSAPGGKKSYLDEQGHMTRGFAMVAWPTKYGNSGVMTFVVGARGIVYQKDLGPDTESAVAKIAAFDPDESWDPTGD